MTMHLVRGMSTTNTKKWKPKKKTQSLLQAEAAHEKFLKKMSVHPSQSSCSLTVKHPPYTRLDVSRLESDLFSNPSGSTIPHSDAGVGYHPSMGKRKENVYTGTEIIGIAQMHKSNAVPIRGKKQAIEIARMRRG